MTTPERRYALCLQSPLKSVLSTSTHHNSKTIEPLSIKLTMPRIQHVSFAELWVKLGRNLPLRHNALLFSIGGMGSIICPVTQTRLDIPKPLTRQSWTTAWSPGKVEPFSDEGRSYPIHFDIVSLFLYHLGASSRNHHDSISG